MNRIRYYFTREFLAGRMCYNRNVRYWDAALTPNQLAASALLASEWEALYDEFDRA